jgi:hypothetical protein
LVIFLGKRRVWEGQNNQKVFFSSPIVFGFVCWQMMMEAAQVPMIVDNEATTLDGRRILRLHRPLLINFSNVVGGSTLADNEEFSRS